MTTTKSKIYTEQEVQDLLSQQRDQIEAVHFEEKTTEVLHEINHRLDESNNYKATIGKDVKSALSRLDAIDAKFKAEDEADQKAKEEHQERAVWYQDWWIRVFGIITIAWELINIYQGMGGTLPHNVK